MPDLDYNGLNSFYGNSLLGIRMHIRCLTRSTRNGEAWSAGETMSCCPLPNRLRVSERSKLLVWWCASRFLSPLSCRLSSFCWAVNRLPYIWTSSCVDFYPPSPWPWSPSRDGILSGTCQKVRKLCINPYTSIVNSLWTDIQAQPQTKAPLVPATPARLWASC